jgi:hypothetical protein
VRQWRLEDGDGGGNDDSLCFYVAITVPQMPLSEIYGIVNLISARRAIERHLIFGACWRHCSARCEIFAENQIFARADLPVCWGPPTLQNRILRNRQKKLKSLKPIRFHRPAAPAGTPAPPHASPRLNGGGRLLTPKFGNFVANKVYIRKPTI